MPYMSRETKRNIALFAAALFAAEAVSVFQPARFPFSGTQSFVYSALLLAWALTIYRRIVHRTLRRCLIAVSLLMLLLFLLRMARYLMFFDRTISRYLWYGYYLPFLTIPVLLFFASLCIGTSDADRPLRGVRWLWVPCAALTAVVLTNDLHGWAFSADGLPMPEGGYAYGWGYLAAVLWQAGLIAAAFALMLRRCRLSQCRRFAWVPVLPVAFFVTLLFIYAYVGSAPILHGYKLYNMQEIYCFGIAGFWECCVQIGLVPSNTGYGELFAMSSVRAELMEADGRIMYRACSAEPLTTGTHLRQRRSPVSGGFVSWMEDHTAIDELNADLEEAAARIEGENDLIAAENEVLAEKARYETQNKIYNHIAWRAHDQLVRIGELLDARPRSEEEFCADIALCAVMGAYVKRRGNLAILAEGGDSITAGDIVLAIRESMEYLALCGVECGVHTAADTSVPPEAALLCYDLFEAVVEAGLPGMRAMMAHISMRDGLRLDLMIDEPSALPEKSWEMARILARGGRLSVWRDDGASHVRLSFERGTAS